MSAVGFHFANLSRCLVASLRGSWTRGYGRGRVTEDEEVRHL